MNFLKLLIINAAIFIGVFYLSATIAFILGAGSSDNYKYESLFYLPGVLSQISVLLYKIIRSEDLILKLSNSVISLLILYVYIVFIWI